MLRNQLPPGARPAWVRGGLAPREAPFVPLEPILLTRRKVRRPPPVPTGMTCQFFQVGEALEREIQRLIVEEREALRQTRLAWLRAAGLVLTILGLATLTYLGLAA